MSRITISTLQSKVEYMVISLGGPPDQEREINKRNEAEFDTISTNLKAEMKTCQTKLEDRTNIIQEFKF